MMTILVIVLFVMLVSRSGGRWHRRGRSLEDGRLAELQQRFDEQQAYVQALEERVMRVEEGLDFTERMLAERSGSPTH
jgi:hypothetical protein